MSSGSGSGPRSAAHSEPRMRRFDLAQQNRSQLATQLQHFPAGTSGRTIVHTAQVPGAAPLSNTS